MALSLLGVSCSDPPPDIILISIDSLRRDALHCYGNPLDTSPTMDLMARGGLQFDNAVSTTSWTLPSHHALLRGLPNPVHGFVRDATPQGGLGGQSIAELLKDEASYQTWGVFSGPYLHPHFGFASGFDQYRSAMSYDAVYDNPREDAMSETDWRRAMGHTEMSSHRDITSKAVTNVVFEALNKRDPDQPLFVFAHFWDVHYDWTPPREYRELFTKGKTSRITGMNVIGDPLIHKDMPQEDLEYLKALYYGEVRWVDSWIQKILEEVRNSDRETIIVLLSDHGDEFFEHGQFGHRNNLYQETLAIPLIVYSTEDRFRPARVEDLVRIYDVAPTLLEVAGVPKPEWMVGQSLLELVDERAEDAEPREAALDLNYQGRFRSRMDGQYKMIGTKKMVAPQQFSVEFELYDLLKDPLEQKNLIQDPIHSSLAARYNKMLDRLEKQRDWIPKSEAPQGGAPPSVRAALEQSGYVGSGSASGTRLDPRFE